MRNLHDTLSLLFLVFGSLDMLSTALNCNVHLQHDPISSNSTSTSVRNTPRRSRASMTEKFSPALRHRRPTALRDLAFYLECRRAASDTTNLVFWNIVVKAPIRQAMHPIGTGRKKYSEIVTSSLPLFHCPQGKATR